MTVYAIGDIHGSYDSLVALGKEIPQSEPLLFIGDLVNRGPKSLETIRWVMGQGSRAQVLLGNHELHLLAVWAGWRQQHGRDTLTPILEAPDAPEIIEWLRQQNLALYIDGFLAVHAATHWKWTLEQTLERAGEVERFLRSDVWSEKIGEIFGKKQWKKSLEGTERLQAIVNVLTRTRYLTQEGRMDFKANLGPDQTDPALIPWFKFNPRKTADTRIVFGHWSTLGATDWPNIYPIDTGCLWGGRLSAMTLEKTPRWVSVESFTPISPW